MLSRTFRSRLNFAGTVITLCGSVFATPAFAAVAPLKPGTIGKMSPSPRLEPLMDGNPSIYMRPNQPDCSDLPKRYDPILKAGDTFVISTEWANETSAGRQTETKVVASVSAQKISEKTTMTPPSPVEMKVCYAVAAPHQQVTGTAATGSFTLQSGSLVSVHGIDRVTSHTTIACRAGSGPEVVAGAGILHEIKIETEDVITDLTDRCSPHTTVFSYINAVLENGTLVSSSKTELLSAPLIPTASSY